MNQKRKGYIFKSVVCQVGKGSVVLANFMSAWHRLESSERREPQLRNISKDLAVGHFLSNRWRRAQPTVGGAIPGLVVLCSIRTRLSSCGKEASKQRLPWSLYQILLSGSCSVWIPVLTSLDDEQWYGGVSQINPFSTACFGDGVSSQ